MLGNIVDQNQRKKNTITNKFILLHSHNDFFFFNQAFF